MQHRTVHDVMTQDVVKARPDTPFKELVALLAENDVTAVPVVDAGGRPVGIVSEADLLRKEVLQPDSRERPTAPHHRATEEARARAATAAETMTTPVVTAHPDWTVPEAARTMYRNGVKRLPVVDDAERLVGIVSRGDLLRVFLRHDTAIREEIVDDVLDRTLWLNPGEVRADVVDGVVTLHGKVEQRSLIPIVERLCGSVDGVVRVDCLLDYEVDDTVGAGGAGRPYEALRGRGTH